MHLPTISKAALVVVLANVCFAELVAYRNANFGGETVTCGYGCAEGQICPFDSKLDNQQTSVRAVDGDRVYHAWSNDGSFCRCIDSDGVRNINQWPTLKFCKQVAWGKCLNNGC
ncbi:hypothetical protein CPC16_012169 [Podila verticillata]|nr:hypothetical protein BGZ59_000925 [Podila verticillata]KAF9394147.1 hypothetical protein CPC16_012169 [Podila verticillata]